MTACARARNVAEIDGGGPIPLSTELAGLGSVSCMTIVEVTKANEVETGFMMIGVGAGGWSSHMAASTAMLKAMRAAVKGNFQVRMMGTLQKAVKGSGLLCGTSNGETYKLGSETHVRDISEGIPRA